MVVTCLLLLTQGGKEPFIDPSIKGKERYLMRKVLAPYRKNFSGDAIFIDETGAVHKNNPSIKVYSRTPANTGGPNGDLHRGSSAQGKVTSISNDGIFTLWRTSFDHPKKYCRVKPHGILFPTRSGQRSKAVAWLKNKFMGENVRFIVLANKEGLIAANILTADDSRHTNASELVHLGLADSYLPNEFPFPNFLKHAKENKLGIWKIN